MVSPQFVQSWCSWVLTDDISWMSSYNLCQRNHQQLCWWLLKLLLGGFLVVFVRLPRLVVGCYYHILLHSHPCNHLCGYFFLPAIHHDYNYFLEWNHLDILFGPIPRFYLSNYTFFYRITMVLMISTLCGAVYLTVGACWLGECKYFCIECFF